MATAGQRALTREENERYCLLLRERARRVWCKQARPNQLPPEGDWRTWLILSGRGWGKTRTGCQWVNSIAERYPKARIGLIAPTAADVRDVVVEGESGILACSLPFFRPLYEPSKRRLTWPNGAMAITFSADEPERLRGPQHSHLYCDELASWRRPETWSLAMFGLRLGDDPKVLVTTTPKPLPIVKELVSDPTTVVVRGTSYENWDNLPEAFFQGIIAKYEGTRLGRQELLAEILDDNPNALWNRQQIEDLRVIKHPELTRIVVAVDPQGTNTEESAETGIVVAGRSGTSYYVLEDATVKASPHGWSTAAVTGYHKYHADRIVGETNNGGDMVGHTISTIDASVAFKKVTASRGKLIRAEPIAALYEQGRVHHVGTFPQLEDQLTEWEPGMPSPDRLDALVWAITELMGSDYGDISLSLNTELRRTSPNIIY